MNAASDDDYDDDKNAIYLSEYLIMEERTITYGKH
jgi:hypothetical protein